MIACFMGHAYGHAGFAMRARAEVLGSLGLDAESFPQLMMETFEQLKQVEALFSLAG